MKKDILFAILSALFLLITIQLSAQVGINSDNSQPDPSAMLDVKSTTKGILPPRVALTAINSAAPVTAPAVGLIVYNTANAGISPNNVTAGYYRWNGTRWIVMETPQGTNVGDMLYWNGTQWVGVPVGTSGQILSLNNGVPFWTQNLAQKPTLLTDSVSAITPSTANGGGNVSDGGAIVTERGLVWSSSPNPTLSDNKINAGAGAGAFSTNLQGLAPNSTYYVRAYATNGVGTGYGNPMMFSTQSGNITLTTTAISSITAGTANSGGDITDDGGASITARGVCWSTVASPTTADVHTVDGAGTGTYSSNISGLLANTSYFVRAYATNSVGTSYGDELTLITSPTPVPPTVITTPDTNVTQTTATCGGDVTSGGGSSVNFRGVCWGTNPTPTIAGNHTTDGSGTGVFTSNLTGLAANTLYYYRAYAVTSSTTSYGNELTFSTRPSVTTTAISAITQTTATSGGNVAIGSGVNVTARGVCWSSTENPTISDSHTTDSSGTGIYTSNLTGLMGNTIYYVRAYAVNISGTSYGSQQTFTTAAVVPAVSTIEASNILLTSAISGGNVTSSGGADVTVRGVCWGTAPNPTTANDKTINGAGMGSFVSSLTGLSPNTLYFLRAYATNSIGTAYGNEITFTTILNQQLPTIITTVISNATQNAATSGGNVTSDGGSAVTFRGVCWSTNTNPTLADSHTTDGSGTGVYISNLTGLTPNTFYHYRAYAVNSVGTAYGNEFGFGIHYIGESYQGGIIFYIDSTGVNGLISSTSNQGSFSWGCSGTLIGGTSTAIGTGQTNTTVIINGCSTANIAASICDTLTLNGYNDWFLPSLDELHQMYLHKTVIGNFPTNQHYYSSSEYNAAQAWKHSFLTGNLYLADKGDFSYVRAIRDFSTTLPTVTTHAATSILLNTATCGGNVTSDGGANVTARGVCWSTVANPTTAGSHTIDGSGTGVFVSSLTGLTLNTLYYARAYAVNSLGTAYGNEIIFTTLLNPQLPTVTTAAITNIDETTATGGGNITSDGGATVTSRGICWSTSSNPTTAHSLTTDGTGTGIFVSNLINLTPNTLYFVRAYATNSVGTAYGNELTLTTLQGLPILSTTELTTITDNSATSGGNITYDGGANITSRGVCWSTSPNPIKTGSHTTDGSGMGVFISNMTGLTFNTLYYVRAYATNSVGTAYGNELTLTTLQVLPIVISAAITNIDEITATGGGNITSEGGATVVSRGICWSTSPSPTTANSLTTDGGGTGVFISNMTGLTPNTFYFVRAYAANSVGTAYGAQMTFTTLNQGRPVLSTTPATNVTQTTAISGGNITSDGGAPVTFRGVCWSTSPNPNLSNSYSTDGGGDGMFVSNLTGLTSNTLYYIRTYAVNSNGTAYGNELTFTTQPVVTTIAASNVLQTTATSGGNVVAGGGAVISSRGVCWGITTNPTTASNHTSDGTGTGGFTSSLTGLTPNTPYFVRAYAVNGAGTTYGNEVSFTTLLVYSLPTVTTTVASVILQTTASSGGNVTSDGNSTVTTRGVCWSTSPSPTIANSKTTNGTGTGVFTSSITGLTPNTLYYLRAYATNSVGTAYGNEVGFTTQPNTVVPTLTTTTILKIFGISATSGGNVLSDGGTGAVLFRGTCWSTSPNPTITDSHTTDGSGIGTFVSNMTNLTPVTQYYVRAYATNSVGTGYGNELIFTTTAALPCTGVPTVTYGGQVYNTVEIGNQCWFRENLNIGESGCYGNNPFNCETYGKLYIQGSNPCPGGWHIPSNLEWTTLTTYLGGANVAGGKMKDVGNTNWAVPNTGADNSSGFTALPGGQGWGGSPPSSFSGINSDGYFWSSTIEYEYDPENSYWYAIYSYYQVNYNGSGISHGGHTAMASDPYWFFSVRCLKD